LGAAQDAGDNVVRGMINRNTIERNMRSEEVMIQISSNSGTSGSILNTAMTNKSLGICLGGVFLRSVNGTQHKVGLIDPWTSMKYGLGFRYTVCVYPHDKNNFHKRFNVKDVDFKRFMQKPYAQMEMEKDDQRARIAEVLKSLKNKEEKSMTAEERKMMELSEQVLEVKYSHKDNTVPLIENLNDLVASIIDKSMGDLQKGIQNIEISSVEPDLLSLPYYWGNIKTEERAPRNRRLLEDPILISEMDSIQPGLMELILTGRAVVSKEVMKSMQNTVGLLRTEAKKDNDRCGELSAMLTAICSEFIVDEMGTLSLNNAMLRFSNACIDSIIDRSQSSKFKFKRKPITDLDEL
jgi:hypothetical protein